MNCALTVSDFLHIEDLQADQYHVIILGKTAATFRKNVETFGDEYILNFRLVSKWNDSSRWHNNPRWMIDGGTAATSIGTAHAIFTAT
jgi:hypothetical protein